MTFDPKYRAQLKKAMVESISRHKATSKRAVLTALPQIWADLETSGLLKEGMTYEGFEEQAHEAYEKSNFEELFSSFFGKKGK